VEIIFLAVIQGLTEFLPVSSSGHLRIFQEFFSMNKADNLSVTLVLHGGTLVAICIYYRKELSAVLMLKNVHLLLMMIVGSVPIAIAGFFLKKFIDEYLFKDFSVVCWGLLTTALVILFSSRQQQSKDENESPGEKLRSLDDLKLKDALLIGIAQCVAIVPGVSRSGATITAALFLGFEAVSAATFSFLLAVPAIAGAVGIGILYPLLKEGLNFNGDLSAGA